MVILNVDDSIDSGISMKVKALESITVWSED